MSSNLILKLILVTLSVHISGCAISGCDLVRSKGFTLTFTDAKNNPLPNIKTKCSGNEAGSTISARYNEQNLTSNANGEIVFPGVKFGKNFSYRSVGLFSWGYKSSEAKIVCSFSENGKEIYKSEFLTNQKNSIINLEI